MNVAIFLEYFTTSKAFRIFNKHTLIVEESVHVAFDESNDLPSKNVLRDVGIEKNMKNLEITQGRQKSQDGISKKGLQSEEVLPQLET